jgi:hypothetical protein
MAAPGKIRDPGELERELNRAQADYNGVRVHAGIGYVTPDDEHTGRGEGIRQARRDGLTAARSLHRLIANTHQRWTTHDTSQVATDRNRSRPFHADLLAGCCLRLRITWLSSACLRSR